MTDQSTTTTQGPQSPTPYTIVSYFLDHNAQDWEKCGEHSQDGEQKQFIWSTDFEECKLEENYAGVWYFTVRTIEIVDDVTLHFQMPKNYMDFKTICDIQNL